MKNFHIYKFLKVGQVNSILLNLLLNYVKNNFLAELDYIVFYYLKIFKYKSSTINFNNYKFCSCLSIDNIICHGIPIFEFFIYKNIKIDISINKKFHSDTCLTLQKSTLNFFFKKFFFYILLKLKNYSFVGKILNFKYNKIFPIKKYCSHFIFINLHSKKIILHEKNNLFNLIKELDSFTIEPMFNYGIYDGYHFKNIFLSNKNIYSFQWEHTILFYKKKKILTTLRKNEICFLQ